MLKWNNDMTTLIKGPSGETRGIVTEVGDGVQLKDKSGKFLGRYSETQDKTYDRQGRYVGNGNQLAMLLED